MTVALNLHRVVPVPARNRIRKWLLRHGMVRSLGTEDRRVLEQMILPELIRRDDIRRVLFVGVAWYTEPYEALFAGKDEYWTLDYDPEVARFGAASNRHIVASATEVGQYFGENSLDLIVCNGVFGWGLNTRPDVNAAFSGFLRALRPGGVLVLGWNDMPESRPFLPDEDEALQRMEPYVFPTLGAAVHHTDTEMRHIYQFYVKP